MGNFIYDETIIKVRLRKSSHVYEVMASDKRMTMHDTSTTTSSSVTQSSPQSVVYPLHTVMPTQMRYEPSPISDEETIQITGGQEQYETLHSIRSLESFQHYSPPVMLPDIDRVAEKPRSKSETDKETVSSHLWRIGSDASSFPYFKPLQHEFERSPGHVDEDVKYTSSPSSMSKSSEGSSASKDIEGDPCIHTESEGARPKILSHQSFKKILRARYLSSQESAEGLSDIETSKDDDAVFEMDIHEEPSVYKTIHEVPEQVKYKSASISGPVSSHHQHEPLDLSRTLATFRYDLPSAPPSMPETSIRPCGIKFHDISSSSLPSDLTAVSSVPVSPRWRKPVHSHVPSPLVTSSPGGGMYAVTCISSPQYLLPAGIHTTSQQISTGMSPRYSPGRSPPTFQSYVGAIAPSPSPQDIVMRQACPTQQQQQKFVFPPPTEMLEPRSQSEAKTLFSCPICTQVFPSYDNLAKHMAKHLPTETVRGADNSKIHYCKVCNRSFSRSDMLTRHMRLHTGLKPYECKVCGQVFSRSDHLNTHQRTHTGEKPYRCPQCPYAACRRDMITRHMRIHLKRWTKRSPFSSSSSEESPQQWSLSSRSSSESTESHDVLMSGGSSTSGSDRLMSGSSMESSEPSPRQTHSLSSMDSTELEMTTQQQQQSWAFPRNRIQSSDLDSDTTLLQRSLSSTTSSGTWTSATSLSSDNNGNGSNEEIRQAAELPEHFQKCTVQPKDNTG